ncbi:hypothetical protein [Streptomyces sp. NPDC060035]|uniref:hypothetical protein n=1 Tax=Streptomyces sp. NPDC060035 TaxID=3347044 RepID=UPI003679EF34
MVFEGIQTALSVAGGTLRGRTGGMWHTIAAWLGGKNAAKFERERRTTLLMVPTALQQGGRIYDQRADGSVLEISVPSPGYPAGVIIDGLARQHLAAAPLAPPGVRRAILRGTEER